MTSPVTLEGELRRALRGVGGGSKPRWAPRTMIFIVDDDRSIRASLKRLMRSAGFEARAFGNANEFLNEVDGDAADSACLILDLHMPGMSGLDLQEVLNHRNPLLPVIVLTATEDAELRARAVAAGALKVLMKPCDSFVLLQAIAEAVGQPPLPFSGLTTGAPAHHGDMRGSDNLDHFVLEGGRALYRPVGHTTFDQAVFLVRAAVAAARRNKVRDLLVNTTALTGFPSPHTFERFLAVVEWAEEARGAVRLVIVARPEMIDPRKIGVTIAGNRGMLSNIFTTEAEASAWLASSNGEGFSAD